MDAPYMAMDALHTDGLTAPMGWYCALVAQAKTIQVELDCYDTGGQVTHVSLALIHQLSTGPMVPNFSTAIPTAETTFWNSRFKTTATRQVVYDSRDTSSTPNEKPGEMVTSNEAGLFLYNDSELYTGPEKFTGWWETWLGNGTEVYYPAEGDPVTTDVIGAMLSLPRTTAIQPWRVVGTEEIVATNLMKLEGVALDSLVTVFLKYPGYVPLVDRDYLPAIIGSSEYDGSGGSGSTASIMVVFGGNTFALNNSYGGIYASVTGSITVSEMWP